MQAKPINHVPVFIFLFVAFAIGTIDQQFFNIPGAGFVVGVIAWVWSVLWLFVLFMLVNILLTLRFTDQPNNKYRDTILNSADGWNLGTWLRRLRDAVLLGLMYFAGHPGLALLLLAASTAIMIQRGYVKRYLRKRAALTI